jgi:C-terminal region of Mon2 protein
MILIHFCSKLFKTKLLTVFFAVEKTIWNQVIGLYPSLVTCTTSHSTDVVLAVQDTLMQYKDLLAPPAHLSNGAL